MLAAFSLVSASPAAAKTCADYDNQAEAQKNKDTRDADGDGIYCEALPCPCSDGKGKSKSDGDKKKAKKRKKKRKKKAKRTYTYRGYVHDVIDGDTIRVELDSGRKVTVRLIGVDAPTLPKTSAPAECGALEAKSAGALWSFEDATDADGDGLLDSGTDGRRVRLVTDNSMAKTDARRRLLAYVYGSDGASLQRTLIKDGWAETYYYRNKVFKKWSVFEDDEEIARQAQAGIFGLCGGEFHLPQ